jgi:flagellin-specific chaperone FliS
MDILIIGIFIIIVLSGVSYAVYQVTKSADIFHRLADTLEEDIRTKDDSTTQLGKLYDLHQKSFHRNTGSRVRELAKMMEIKYDMEILKN